MKLLPILAAGFAYFALGGIWFTPLFGRQWDKAVGFERPPKWRPSAVYYIGPLLGCLVAAFATSFLAQLAQAQLLADYLKIGLLVGIGVWRNYYHGKRHRSKHASSRPLCCCGRFVSPSRFGTLRRSLILAVLAVFQC